MKRYFLHVFFLLPAIVDLAVSELSTPTTSTRLPSVYTGCGEIKGCFSLPGPSCIQDRSCLALVTYAIKGQSYELELWASNSPSNSYVAFGISEDKIMGDDSVTECTLVNGRVNAYMSYNVPSKTNVRLRDATSGLKVNETKYIDGNLYCRLERHQTSFVVGDVKTLDLTKPHYLLLAQGPASDSGVLYHGTKPIISPKLINLAETGSVRTSNSGTSVKLNGAFIVVSACMFAAICILQSIVNCGYVRQYEAIP